MNTPTSHLRQPSTPWATLLISAAGLIIFALLLIFGTGCTVSRLHSDSASVTTYTVAWPWLDTTRALDKAKVTSATNRSEINLSGYAESERASTNSPFTPDSLGTILGAAIKAAR